MLAHLPAAWKVPGSNIVEALSVEISLLSSQVEEEPNPSVSAPACQQRLGLQKSPSLMKVNFQ